MRARRVALLYDMHGNSAALEAVLDDLDGKDVDALAFGGDYALKGPRPAEVVDRIREFSTKAILGNTDEYLLSDDEPHASDPLVEWTNERLGASGRQWLFERPFETTVTPPGGTSPTEDLKLVHATPTDIEAPLLLEDHPTAEWPRTSSKRASELLGDIQAGCVVYGHVHVASSGVVDGIRLRSVGSVGLPWDGDPRAAYAIASWDGDRWNIDDHRVDYDYESVARETESKLPDGEVSAESLRRASFEPFAEQ